MDGSAQCPASHLCRGQRSVQAHENGRDSRLLWANSRDSLLSIGFNQVREREVRLWDTRAFIGSLASVTLDASPR
ncbi:UNVERIFIED_CONTAM: Coronin-7 [Gekko kuhli]